MDVALCSAAGEGSLRLLPILLLTACATTTLAQGMKLPPEAPRNLKVYYLCTLVKTDKWMPNDPESAKLFPQHMAFIRKMTQAKKFLIAGPFLDEGEGVGIYVIAATSADEAKAMASGDPEVKAGKLSPKVRQILLPNLSPVKIVWPAQRKRK